MEARQPDRVPYVGPRPYNREEKDLFFGRDREIDELLSLVIAHRVVLLYAESGAGKTSLIHAGLVPALEEEGFEVLVTRLRAAIPKTLKAGEVGNVYVFGALLNLAPKADRRSLAGKPLAASLAERPIPSGTDGQRAPRALVFDQFEEIFTFETAYALYPERWREQQAGFFNQVAEALEGDPLLRVIFVIREDFLARLDPFAGLLPRKLQIRFRLERLREKAALEAVTGPLQASGRSFVGGTAEELVGKLLIVRMDVGLGETLEVKGEFVEPVQLQLVCHTLWRELPPEVTEITPEHLQAFGNVDQVLALFYDEAVREASQKAQMEEIRLREWCEEILITSMGTRGSVYRAPGFTGGVSNEAVDVLEAKHLVRAEWRAGARWYELSHDRLIEPIQRSNRVYLMQTMGWSEQEDTQLKAYMAIARGDEARGIEDYEAALASYEDALQIYRHTGDQWGAANILLSLADLHADMEEYARALELYSEVVRFTISDLESRLYDLEHGLGEGLLQRAIAYLRRALRRDTPDWIIDLQARAFGGRAGVYWYSERYAQAIADYTRAIELKPDSFYAYSGRGQVRAEIGEYVKALEDLDRALGIGTEDSIAEAYARNGRGLACGGLRRYQEAFKEFDASIDRSPDNGWVYYNRAQVYERMEEFGKAREDYQTALEKNDPPLHALKREKAGARLRELESKGR